MKPVTRRSVMAGSAAVVAAVPAVGLCVAIESPIDKVRRLGKELEQAMLDAYGPGKKLAICEWGAHARDAKMREDLQGCPPIYMVAVHPAD